MTTFTIDYLIWHHFGKHVDQCHPDIIRQYRTYFQNHPNPRNLAMFIESYLKYFESYLKYLKKFYSVEVNLFFTIQIMQNLIY